MAHPQNSPRGLWEKNTLKVPTGGSIGFDSTSRTITADSTGIKVGSRYISTNTTGNTTT